MFVRLRKLLQVAGTSLQSFVFVFVFVFLQVAGTSLQSFLCLARTLGLPEFVEQVQSQNPDLVFPLVPLLFIGPTNAYPCPYPYLVMLLSERCDSG